MDMKWMSRHARCNGCDDVNPAVPAKATSVSIASRVTPGTLSASVPEPGTLWLGSTAVVVGTLAAYGRKRLKGKEQK